jgi:hypothetical protein
VSRGFMLRCSFVTVPFVFSVRVRVGSEGAGNGCSVDEASLFGRWIAGHRQAVSRTEGSRRSSMDVALRPLRRRDPDEMVSISPS